MNGGIEGKLEVRSRISDQKNRQGQINEHGGADELKCIHFNTSSIMGIAD